MKNLLSILIFFGASVGTATAQTPASLYGSAYGADYRANGNTEFAAEDMQFDHTDFAGLQDRFDFSGISRLYTPRLGSAPFAGSFGDQFGGPGFRQFGFGTSYSLGPTHAILGYRSISDMSGLLLSRNTTFGGSFTFVGRIKLSGLYQFGKTELLPDSRDTREWILGASAPFGANTFMASYIRHLNKTMNNADASLFSLGYDYSLSKQTHFYTSFSRLFNEGAALRLYAPGDGENLFNAGIRHQF